MKIYLLGLESRPLFTKGERVKKLAFVLCGFFFLSIAQADEMAGQNKFMIGASGSFGFMDRSSEYFNNQGFEIDQFDGDKSLSGFGGSARLGYDVYFKPTQAIRIYADYIGASFNKDEILGRMNLNHIGVNVDYYRYDFASGFGVFTGAGAVYNMGKTNLGNIDGIGVGFNVGGAYVINDYVELELRMKFILAEYFNNKAVNPVKLPNGAGAGTITAQNLDLDAPMYLMLGLG